jgi:hypothetical protein
VQIDPRTPTTKNPPEQFTDDVWLDPIASPREDGQRMNVAKVPVAVAEPMRGLASWSAFRSACSIVVILGASDVRRPRDRRSTDRSRRLMRVG